MKKFFDPKTTALIGASSRPMRPGNNLFKNLTISFGDDFYPVNPNADEIEGKPCYPSILDAPADVDVAIVFVTSKAVPGALEQCAEKGVRRVIIESGGFAEAGPEGIDLHERSLAIAREAGMRVWGPNCMGLINVTKTKVLSFLTPFMWQGAFRPGGVSLVVQSGMLSAGFLAQILTKTPFGLAKVASIGNKMDVDESDVLEYLADDPDTEVIALYLESIERGRRFFELCRSTDKPVVVLKSGRTAFGGTAAASHTAALAQDDAVLDSALRQAGVIRVYDMNELMDVARCLGVAKRAPIKRPRVAVMSFSGGAGVVTSDDIFDRGMELATLSPETVEKLRAVFPEWMDPNNPVDLYPAIEKNGPMETVKKAIEAVMDDPGVDAVYAHLFAAPIKIRFFDYDHMAETAKKAGKPLVAWVMGHADTQKEILGELESRGIPSVEEIGKGVRIMAALTMRK